MEQLARDIAEYITRPESGDFETLILRLFHRQYAQNAAYRIFCDSLDASPKTVSNWQEIPAAPARAFKITDLSCVLLSQVKVVFHSSGTTEGQPSKHYLDLDAVTLYETSLKAGYAKYLPMPQPIIALMPSPIDAPHSSLSFMLGALGAESFYAGGVKGLESRLSQAVDEKKPVTIFGTAFAFLELFDQSVQSWILPEGSKVVETGGFKGRTRQVTREELYRQFNERLGIGSPNALAEYGMSEMASQYYGTPESGLSGQHWLRTRIIDPITELDADEGILRHCDLANWNSVAVIQTQDMARWTSRDRDHFVLLGRAPGAELRGCSLSVEERWLELKS